MDKFLHIWNVFKGHFAAQKVAFLRALLIGEVVCDKVHSLDRFCSASALYIRRVVTQPGVVSQITKQREKLAFAAADFDEVLAV